MRQRSENSYLKNKHKLHNSCSSATNRGPQGGVVWFKKINFEVETKTPSNFFPFAISVNCVKYYLSKSPQSGCSLTTKFGQSACLVEVAQYACTCLLIFLKR